MLIKSRAFVLHVQKYNDASSIVTLYTEQEGAVSFLVRIPKTSRASIKSKMFQPLNLLEIEWDMRDGKSLKYLKNCVIWKSYASLPYHPLKTPIALFIYEFLYHVLKNDKPSHRTFEYILNALLWLDVKEERFSNFHLIFMSQMSYFLGFEPNLNHSEMCKVFDMQNSCYVKEYPCHPYYIKGIEAQFLPFLLRLNYRSMHLLQLSRGDRNRILELLCLYYRLHVPGFPELKSLEVLHELFN